MKPISFFDIFSHIFHDFAIQTMFGLRINENLFKAFLYTECAYSECEPQGGEKVERRALLKRRRGYGNRPKCHSEEQSDVGIP